MRPLTLLVTASGAPGAAALLRALKENGEREVRVVGCDMNPVSIGRFRADAFHVVPAGHTPEFVPAVLDVCKREGVDVLLPESSNDILELAKARAEFEAEGITVMVSRPEAIERAENKGSFFELLDEVGVRAPEWRRVRGGRELEAAVRELGYPDRAVCFKPPVEKGGRGFRILDPTIDRAHELLHGRPGSVAMRLEEAVDILPPEGGEELLVMELAEGQETAVDGFARDGKVLLAHPKVKDAFRASLAMYFETLDSPYLDEVAEKIVAGLGLDHFFSVNVVGEVPIEINPRISTWVYQEDVNMPWLGVRNALGELSDDDLAEYRARIRPTRRALRYFDQVEWDD